jgi:hypothetical protein
MVRQCTGKGLKRFFPEGRENLSPFKYARINLAPDQGPNMICTDLYLARLPELSRWPNREMMSTNFKIHIADVLRLHSRWII